MNTPSSKGKTYRIRKELDFLDDHKWKRFSKRRLELINKFQLATFKASQQNENVKQIASILRTEFGYPINTSVSFERLVTAAVQSVRRNMKRPSRSKKNKESMSPLEISLETPLETPIGTPLEMPQILPSLSPFQMSPLPTLPILQKKKEEINAISTKLPGENVKLVDEPLILKPEAKVEEYNETIKSVIKDMVQNVIPLSQQSENDMFDGPNLSIFTNQKENHEKLLLTANDHSQNADGIPFFLREKIIRSIQKSRTCFELIENTTTFCNSKSLKLLGDSAYKTAAAYVMERFFSDMESSSMDYILSSALSDEQISEFTTDLFAPATRIDLKRISISAKVNLLWLTLGSIVKDFGFDPMLYDISETINYRITQRYPLASKKREKIDSPLQVMSQKSQFVSNDTTQRAAVLSTLSMKPQLANKDVYRKIIIKYGAKEQEFSFQLLSNSPPTLKEIIDNSKTLFSIKNNHVKLYNDNKQVTHDITLAKLFNDFSTQNLHLELKQ